MAKPKMTPQTPGEPVPGPENTQAPDVLDTDPTQTTETVQTEPNVESPVAVEATPDESEIDPAAIDRPVLSQQGWVVPHKAI